MSWDGSTRLHSNDGERSPHSTDVAVDCRKVTGRSYSTDEGYGGEFVNKKLKRSWASQFHSTGDVSVAGCSPSREVTETFRAHSWTLPTNIVYGPQDVVRSTEDLQWSNPSENPSNLQEHTFTRNDALNPRILTRGPAKDFIRRNMNRSRSMDEDYGSIDSSRDMGWGFPADDYGFCFKDDKRKKKETKITEIPWKADSRVVTWGIAKTVPATTKASSSNEDKHKKIETKKAAIPLKEDSRVVTWGIAKTIPVTAKRSSSKDEEYKKRGTKTAPIPSAEVPKEETRATAKTVPVTTKHSSSKVDKQKKTETKKGPRSEAPTGVHAKAAPVTTKRSSSTDEKHKKKRPTAWSDNPKDVTWTPARAVAVTAKRSSSTDEKHKKKETTKGPTASSEDHAETAPVATKRSSSTDEKHKKKRPTASSDNPKDVTWTPARAVAVTAKRSSSTDEKHKKKETTKGPTASSGDPKDVTWTPARAVAVTAKRSSSTDEKHKKKETTKGPTASSGDPKDVTWTPARAVAVTAKRSSSTDEKHKKKETTKGPTASSGDPKDVTGAPANAVPVTAKRSTRWSSSKDDIFNPGRVEVLPTKRVTRSSRKATETVSENVKRDVKISASKDEVSSRRGRKPVAKKVSVTVKRLSLKDKKYSAAKNPGSLSTSIKGVKKKRDDKAIPKDSLPPVKRFTGGNEKYGALKQLRSLSTDSGGIQRKWDEKAFPKDTLPPVKRFTWANDEYSATKMKRSVSTDSVMIQGFPRDTLPPVKRFTWGNEECTAPKMTRSVSTDSVMIQGFPKDTLPPIKRFTWGNDEYSAPKMVRSLSTDSGGIHKRDERAFPTDSLPPIKRFTWGSLSTDNLTTTKKTDEKAVPNDARATFTRFTWRHLDFCATKLIRSFSADSIGIYKKKDKKSVHKDVRREKNAHKKLTSADKMLSSDDEEYRVARWPSTDSIDVQKKRNKKAARREAAKKKLTSKDEEYPPARVAGRLSTDSVDVSKKSEEKPVPEDATSKMLPSKTVESSAGRLTKWPSTDSIDVQKKRNKKAARKDAAKKRLTSQDVEFSAAGVAGWLSTDRKDLQEKRHDKPVPEETMPPENVLTSIDEECSAARVSRWLSTDSIGIQKKNDENTVTKNATPPEKTLTSQDVESSGAKRRTCSTGIQTKKAERTDSNTAQPPVKILTSKDKECSAASVAGWLSRDEKPAKILTPKDKERSAASVAGWLPTSYKEIQKKGHEKKVPKDEGPREKMLSLKDVEHSGVERVRSLSTCSTGLQKKKAERTDSKDAAPPVKILTPKDKERSAASVAGWLSRDETPAKILTPKDKERSAASVAGWLSRDETPAKILTPKDKERSAASVAGWLSRDETPAKILTPKDKERSAASVAGWLPTNNNEIQKKGHEKTVQKDARPPEKMLTSPDVEHSGAKRVRSNSTCSTEIQKKKAERTDSKDAQPTVKIFTSKDKEHSAASVAGWLSTDNKDIQKKGHEKAVHKDARPPEKMLTSQDGNQKKKAERTDSKYAQPPVKILTSKDKECSAASVAGWLSRDETPAKILTPKDKERSAASVAGWLSRDETPAKILTPKDKERSAASVAGWLPTSNNEIQKKGHEKTVQKDARPPEKMLTSPDVEHSGAKRVRSNSTCSTEIQKKKAERTDSKDAQPTVKIFTSKDKEHSAASVAGWLSTDNKDIQKKGHEKAVHKDARPPEKMLTSQDGNQKKKAERTDSKYAQPPVKILTSKDKECSAASVAGWLSRDETPAKILTPKDKEHSAASFAGWLSTDNKDIQKKGHEKTVRQDARPPEKMLTSPDVESSGAKRVRSLSTCSTGIQTKKSERADSKDAQPLVKILTSKDKECSAARVARWLSTDCIEVQKNRDDETAPKDTTRKMLASKDVEYSGAKRVRSLSTCSVGIQKKTGEEAFRKDAQPSDMVLTSRDEKYGAVKILKSIPTRSIWIQKKMAEKSKVSSKHKEYNAAKVTRWLSTDCLMEERTAHKDTTRKMLTSKDVAFSGAKRERSISTGNIWNQKKRAVCKEAPSPIPRLSSDDVVCTRVLRSMVKRSRSMDDDICPRTVTRTSRKDISSPRRSSKIKTSNSLEKVARSLSHDSTASSRKSAGKVESSHCFEETFHNIGLLERSRSMDDDICPRRFPRSSRKDLSSARPSPRTRKSKNLEKATRSLSHDSTTSSMDDDICPRRFPRSSRKDLSSSRRSSRTRKSKNLGKATRSLSHDSTTSSTNGAVGVESSHCLGEEYYNTGLLKRSHSMDDDAYPMPVTRPSRKDISSLRRSSKTKKSKIIGTRPLSHESTADSTKLGEEFESSHCFGEEYNNSSLSKRSRTLRSTDKDIHKKRGNKVPKSAQTPVKGLTSKDEVCSIGMVLRSMAKRSRSMDDDICPRPDSRKSPDIPGPPRSTKIIKSRSVGKVTRLINLLSLHWTEDSFASSTNVGEGDESSHCFGDRYYNTGLVRRSRSMDDDIWPQSVTRTSRKDISSPLSFSKTEEWHNLSEVKASLAIGTESSANSAERGSLLKRSRFMDDDICPRYVTQTSRRDILSPTRSSKNKKSKNLGNVSRSQFHDSTESLTNVAVGAESSHFFGDMYYNSGLVRRSRSMDDDIWPQSVIETSRKDISSPQCFSETKECNNLAEVEGSLAIGTESSTNSAGRSRSLKRPHSIDDDTCPRSVTQTSRKDVSSPTRSSKPKNLGNVSGSLSHDSIESLTNVSVGAESSHFFRDKYYNTGLVRRSRSMDDDIWPQSVTRTSRKDISSSQCFSETKECNKLAEVEGSLAIGTESSTNSGAGAGSTQCFGEEQSYTGSMKKSADGTRSPIPLPQTTDLVKTSRSLDSSEAVVEVEIPIAVNRNASEGENCGAGKEKRSESIDGGESVKSVMWANCEVARSVSIDVTRNSTNSSGGSGSTSCFGGENSNIGSMEKSADGNSSPIPVPQPTDLEKRSRSLDRFETVAESIPEEIAIACNESAPEGEDCAAGKEKRSQSTEGSMKRVRWASPKELNNYYPGKLQRSASMDCPEGPNITTWVPKSILKKTQGNIYYDTTKMPRSCSIDELCSHLEGSPSEGETFDILKLLQTGDDESVKDCNPATKTPSKIITWSLRKEGERSENHKAPKEHDNSSSKQVAMSALKDNMNAKKVSCPKRSDSRNTADKCETTPGTSAKATCSKIETSLPKTSSETSKAVERPAVVNDNTQSTKVRSAEAANNFVKTKPCPVAPADTNKKPTPIHEDRNTIKLLPSSSWDEAITGGDRNTLSLAKRKRTASTDIGVEKKIAPSECKSAPPKMERTASSDDAVHASSSRNDKPSSNKAKKSFHPTKHSKSLESKVNEKSERQVGAEKRSASKEDAGRPSKLKRLHSKDNVSSSRDSKRDSGTLSEGPAASKRKVERQCKSAPSKPERTASRDDGVNASSSGNDKPSSNKAKKSFPRLKQSKVSESNENEKQDRAKKRTASKEDAGPSKVKRSHSKDDVSRSRGSKRGSSTLSEGPSASKRKVQRRTKDDDSSSSSSEESDSLSEDSDSSAEVSELGDTDSSYVPKRQYNKKSRRERFDCAVCSRSFSGMTDLRRHLLIHADEKPHVCEICKKSYRQYVNLRNHMKVEHFKSKEFVCPFCMRPFALKLRLKLHLRVHIGEKQFICPKCPKTFNRNIQLAHHLKSHGMVADNTCGVCQVTCANERSLKLHMERHVSKDNLCLICKASFENEMAMRSHMSLSHGNLKHFECQICEKQIQDDLDTHMKTHAKTKRHECEVCKKVFAQKTQYNIHMRTHTGERPFQCRVCWQNFGHANVLKLHIRKHTGEKPFKCVLCIESPHAFSQLSHLKTHLRTIHNQDSAYICEDCKKSFKKKFHLDAHIKTCDKVKFDVPTKEEEKLAAREAEELAQLRYLMAVLLKKISSREKLAILGFEKRLIDNVLIAALKLSNNKAYDSKTIHPLDQMKLNIQTFLEWTVPESVMHQFKMECPSVESILEKIVELYLKQQVR